MSLVQYRSTLITEDTREAMSRLEQAAAAIEGVQVKYGGVPVAEANWASVEKEGGPLALSPAYSMRPAGREVYLGLEGPFNKEVALATLWSLAVPLGFVPWCRFPVPGVHDNVFHYLGPWSSIGDFLHGEGRGEHAWPSMCCAAQIAVGNWEGPKIIEREVQMHLHRLGVQCGPVDGMLGPRSIASLKALGLGSMELKEMLPHLRNLTPPQLSTRDRQQAHIHIGSESELFTSGQVRSIKTPTGYALTIDGPGRAILMVD